MNLILRNELEALFTMYRKLVTTAQSAAPASVIGQPTSKVDVSGRFIYLLSYFFIY